MKFFWADVYSIIDCIYLENLAGARKSADLIPNYFYIYAVGP